MRVNVSSIVQWGYQANFNLVFFFVFFFYEKISRAQKHVTPRSLCARENCCLCCLVLACFCFVI